jgi:hypothetical protein
MEKQPGNLPAVNKTPAHMPTMEQPTQPVGSDVIPVEIQSQCEIDHGVGSGDRDPKSRSSLACP